MRVQLSTSDTQDGRPDSAFVLPDHLAAKADPSLVARDEQHFAAIRHTLDEALADLAARLDAARRAPGGKGQAAMDRDLEIHRLTARIMAEAEPVIRAALPDANVPTSIRRTGVPVRHGRTGDLGQVLDAWLAAHSALSEHAPRGSSPTSSCSSTRTRSAQASREPSTAMWP